MQVHQAYRYELDPNAAQRVLLAKHAGVARFAYNWGLQKRIELFETNEGKDRFTTAIAQHRVLNALKASAFPWMYEVSKCAPQEALRDLERAFRNFWRGRQAGRNVGFPRFKKKGVSDSFRLTGSIQVQSQAVQLPRLGKLRTKEATEKFSGRVLSATVSREADRWYVSLAVETERPDPVPVQGEAVGVDVGIDAFATLSDSTKIASPNPLHKALKRLRRASKQHSRKTRGSNNRKKSACRLARLHRRVKNIRRDFLHKTSTTLAKTKSVIVVEDLHVKGMLQNKHLARHIADAGWGDFRRMLAYKTVWYGSTLVVAPRFYASSKTCSSCGHLMSELPLQIRSWSCPACSAHHDRDINAAMNLQRFSTGSSPGIDACGDCSGGECGQPRSSYQSLKQEAMSR